VIAKAMPLIGPVLHGDDVAWGEGGVVYEERAEPIRVLAASPERATRVLYEGPHPSKGQPGWSIADLAASPDAIAFVRAWSDCEPAPYDQYVDRTDIAVGPAGKPFQLLPRHDKGCEYFPASHQLDVEGSRLAFSGPFCAPGCMACARLALDDVRDVALPRIVVPNPGAADDFRIAGSFIAVSSVSWQRARVFDLSSGKLVYQARIPAGSMLDLQADGKLVAVSWKRDVAGRRTAAAWFSPEQPSAHAIPINPVLGHSYDEPGPPRIAVRIANDRLAFEQAIAPDRSELVVTDLNGNIVEHVASFDAKRARVADFDFDGKRVTWATREVRDVKKECWRISEVGHMACLEHYLGPTTIYVAHLR